MFLHRIKRITLESILAVLAIAIVLLSAVAALCIKALGRR